MPIVTSLIMMKMKKIITIKVRAISMKERIQNYRHLNEIYIKEKSNYLIIILTRQN